LQGSDNKTIEFEPLRVGMMGQLVTKTNRWYFADANTIEKTSMVTLAYGSSMNFELSATDDNLESRRAAADLNG